MSEAQETTGLGGIAVVLGIAVLVVSLAWGAMRAFGFLRASVQDARAAYAESAKSADRGVSGPAPPEERSDKGSATSKFQEAIKAVGFSLGGSLKDEVSQLETKPMGTPRAAGDEFYYAFNSPGVLHESASPEKSSSAYWWLGSGGMLEVTGVLGRTIAGDLPLLDPWRVRYALANATDTDNGLHPQNIFRLVSIGAWGDHSIEAPFRILDDHLSESPNRNASNGLLLMSRYQDDDTLYYAGVRVDGDAVIKKKYRGTYYTLAEKEVFGGAYDRAGAPSLLPHETWISLMSSTEVEEGGAVRITLSMRLEGEGAWRPLLSVLDDGVSSGVPPITEAGRVGIRTDFMDVEFGDIVVTAR